MTPTIKLLLLSLTSTNIDSNTLSTKAKVMKIVIDILINDDIDRHK